MVVNKEPDVKSADVATGTQVLLVDRVQASSGATWYPIAPVATEVRYLPREALQPNGTVAASNPWNAPVVPTAGYTNNSYPQANGTPVAYASPNPNNLAQLNQLAEQALAAGKTDSARLLYLEALNQTNDPQWRNYLQGRLASLAPASSWNPSAAAPGYQGAPAQTVPNYSTTAASPFNPTSIARPAGGDASFGNAPPAGIGQKRWADWGVLRSTTITAREGGPMYVLEDIQNRRPLMYVTTAPGQSLREYVGQTINVYGTFAYRNDPEIRLGYIVAEQIATPPAR
jgi:hypothetical protein